MQLSYPQIQSLIRYVWSQRDNPALSLDFVRAANDYQKCCSQFPDWAFLFDAEINCMIRDLREFFTYSHNYNVIDDKIGYKHHDNIIFNLRHGYNTLFAYFLEHERGNIRFID